MKNKLFHGQFLMLFVFILAFQIQNALAQAPFTFRKTEIDSNTLYNDSTFKKLQRFEREIKKFDAEANVIESSINGILFIGSSSIRLWKTLAQDFSPNPVINRGFGGATIPEILYYFNRITTKCKPSAIVVYAGENDLAFDSAKVNQTLINFKRLMNAIAVKFPQTPIYFLSIKPSPKRWNYDLRFLDFNSQIKKIILKYKYLKYIDIRQPMLINGMLKKDIFQADSLHLNASGYSIWTKSMKAELVKDGFKFDGL